MSGENTTNWPDLAIALYDRLTDRRAEIVYEFEEVVVKVPSRTGANAQHADWGLSGMMKMRTSNQSQIPN